MAIQKGWSETQVERGSSDIDDVIANLIVDYLGKYVRDHSSVPVNARDLIADRKAEWREVFALAFTEGESSVRDKVKTLKRSAAQAFTDEASQETTTTQAYTLPGFSLP